MIQMIMTIKITIPITPKTTPALNIPPTILQLSRKNSTRHSRGIKYFRLILNWLLISQFTGHGLFMIIRNPRKISQTILLTVPINSSSIDSAIPINSALHYRHAIWINAPIPSPRINISRIVLTVRSIEAIYHHA